MILDKWDGGVLTETIWLRLVTGSYEHSHV
jgi:hypothetical protein